MTQLQLNCFKLDGFIIYIKVSFVTNQYCCLIFLPGWSGCDQSACLHFVSSVVKPDYGGAGQADPAKRKDGKRGKMLIVFQLGIRCRMMSAGGGSMDGTVLLLDELSVCLSAALACFSSSLSTIRTRCVQVRAGSA